MKKYSVGVRCAWQIASWEAVTAKSSFIEQEHLLIGLLSLDKLQTSVLYKTLADQDKKRLQQEQVSVTNLIQGLNIPSAELRRRLRERLPHKRFSITGKIIHRSESTKKCFKHAGELVNNSPEIDALILLAAIMSHPGKLIEQEFTQLGIPTRSVWIKALATPLSSDHCQEEGISGSDFASIQTFTKHSQSTKLTIMFDDIVGSMVLYHRLGDDEFFKLIKYHDETIKKVIQRKGRGEIIKSTGDGLLMVFSSPAVAVECALDIQKEFLAHNLLKIRIGMDMGEVKQVGDEKSKDIFGIRVSSANRIMCAAEGGHILTSKAVFEEAQKRKSEQSVSWKYLGSRSFKPGEPIIDIYEVYDPQIQELPMKELPVEVLTEPDEKPTVSGTSRSLLDRFGKDLSIEAAEGRIGPYAERRNEILQVIQTLVQRYCNNPLLIGKAGVGKSALVEAVALKLNQSKNILPKKRIIELNMNLLMAGVKDKKDCEKKLHDLLKEIQLQGDVILFMDEIHNYVGNGKQDIFFTVAHVFNPALIQGKIQCIGTTNPDEFNRQIKSEASLERGFQKIIIHEPSDKETFEMLTIFRKKLEEYHHIWITDRALEAAILLSKQFDPDHYLPAKAIDLLDEAGAQIQIPDLKAVVGNTGEILLESEVGMANKILNVLSIVSVMSQKTTLPVKKIMSALEEQHLPA